MTKPAINISSAGTVDYTDGGIIRPKRTKSVTANLCEVGIPVPLVRGAFNEPKSTITQGDIDMSEGSQEFLDGVDYARHCNINSATIAEANEWLCKNIDCQIIVRLGSNDGVYLSVNAFKDGERVGTSTGVSINKNVGKMLNKLKRLKGEVV